MRLWWSKVDAGLQWENIALVYIICKSLIIKLNKMKNSNLKKKQQKLTHVCSGHISCIKSKALGIFFLVRVIIIQKV